MSRLVGKASTPKCAVIPGIEYSSPNDDIHVVTMGTPRFHGARQDLLETIPAVRARGVQPCLRIRVDATPSTRSLATYGLLDGIEIWNRKVDGLLPVQAYFRLARNRGLAPIVAMDLHTWRQIFPMWKRYSSRSGAARRQHGGDGLRERQMAPACIVGRLEPGLDGGFSLTLSSLVAAEQLRRPSPGYTGCRTTKFRISSGHQGN